MYYKRKIMFVAFENQSSAEYNIYQCFLRMCVM